MSPAAASGVDAEHRIGLRFAFPAEDRSGVVQDLDSRSVFSVIIEPNDDRYMALDRAHGRRGWACKRLPPISSARVPRASRRTGREMWAGRAAGLRPGTVAQSTVRDLLGMTWSSPTWLDGTLASVVVFHAARWPWVPFGTCSYQSTRSAVTVEHPLLSDGPTCDATRDRGISIVRNRSDMTWSSPPWSDGRLAAVAVFRPADWRWVPTEGTYCQCTRAAVTVERRWFSRPFCLPFHNRS